MRCHKVKKHLFLLAGNDLPQRKKRSVESHLENCPECAVKLEPLKRTKESIQKIAQTDLPGALPLDFSERVTRSIAEEQETTRHTRVKSLFLILQKPAAIAGIFALEIVLIAAVLLIFNSPGKVTSDRLLKEILVRADKGDSELAWDPENIFFKAFDGPFRLDSWEPPKQSGVYAVLHKTASDAGPDTYIIDYCGQGRNLSLYRGYPWIRHRLKRLIARTGSPENVYIAVFLMPDSSRMERRQIEQALVKTFNPFFNRGV
jgi:hypothetical protein